MRLLVDIDEEAYKDACKSKLPHIGLSRATIEAVKGGEKVTGIEPVIPYKDNKELEESQEDAKSNSPSVIKTVISVLAILFFVISIIFVLINVIAHLATGITIETLIEATSALEITMLFIIFIWKIVKHFWRGDLWR